MNYLKERLERGAALLEFIDRRREETRCPKIAASIERAVVDRELRELEEEMRRLPATPERQVVRVRRSRP
jgi:hypothetical protein